MVLQSTGTISLSQIQTEFGGTNPINMSEYYNNSASYYTQGVTGIPSINATISFSQFLGKAKYVPVTASVPSAVATNFVGTYTTGPGGGNNTGYEAITGCAGVNLSRSDVSTFNNIGSQGLGRSPVIYYASLILQARAGDTIRITVNTVVSSQGDAEIQRVYINYGTGYVYIGGASFNGNAERSVDYVVPSGTVGGNYGICCTNDYGGAGGYTSVNYYSLQIW